MSLGSYATGFAKRDGIPHYPSLWQNCVAAWEPTLGPSGSVLRDWSGYGRHGTLTNMAPGTDWIVKEGRYALDYDDTDDYVKVADGTIAATLPNSTVSVWFRTTNLSVSSGYAIYCERAASGSDIFKIDYGDPSSQGEPLFTWRNDAGSLTQLRLGTVPAANDDEWHHFAVRIVGTSVKIFYDVVYTATGTISTKSFTNSGLECRIGGDPASATSSWGGQLGGFQIWNRGLSDNEISLLGLRPAITFELAPRRRAAAAVVATASTLTAAQSSFTLTGQAAALAAGRKLAASQASFTLTGQAAGLVAARKLVATQASFTLTGQAATLGQTHILTATDVATGAPSVGAPAVGQTHTLDIATVTGSVLAADNPVLGQTHVLTANSVTTGSPSVGTPFLPIIADQGDFALAVQDASLVASRKIAAAQASFTLAGQDAAFVDGRYISAAQGTITLSGQDASLVSGNNIAAGQASFVLTGQSAAVVASRELTAAQDALTLSAQDAGLLLTRRILAGQGSFTLTGQAADITPSGAMQVEHGAFVLTGQTLSLSVSRVLAASSGSFAASGQDVSFTRVLSANAGSFAVGGQNVTLTYSLVASSPSSFYYYLYLGV